MGERQTEVCTRGRPVTEAPITTVSNLEVSSSILDDAILTSSVSISAHIRRGTFFFSPSPPSPEAFPRLPAGPGRVFAFSLFFRGGPGAVAARSNARRRFQGGGGSSRGAGRPPAPRRIWTPPARPAPPPPPRRRRIPPPSPSPTPHPPPWPPFSPDTPFGHSLGQGDGRLIAQGEEATDPRRPGGAVGGGVQGEGERRARDRSAACRCTTTGWRA